MNLIVHMFFFLILFYWFFLILYIFLTVCSLSSGSSWYFIFLASKLFFVLLSNAPLLSECLMDFLPLISFERTKSQGKYCHKKILCNWFQMWKPNTLTVLSPNIKRLNVKTLYVRNHVQKYKYQLKQITMKKGLGALKL